jgi:tRNA threonylcarbamoyl adenosine modification protein YeaZ
VKILALDSSSPVASVAFVTTGEKEPEVRFRCDTPHKRSDSSALFEGFQSALAACGLPDALCIGLGPGSYNGLRAGIAAGRAFATALGIPLLALPSPLALPGPDSGFWAAGDARGGHYWIACVAGGAFLEEPRLLLPDDVATHLQGRPEFPILGASPLRGLERLLPATPDAGRLAILAKRADPITGTPEPLYLKPPHITLPAAS